MFTRSSRNSHAILIYCEPIGVQRLWDDFLSFMIEDYPSTSNRNIYTVNLLLRDLNGLLLHHHRRIEDYDLPIIDIQFGDVMETPSIIQDEISVDVPTDNLNSISKLNDHQRRAYDIIIGTTHRKENAVCFIDGPGGTGKTFLYRAILATLRNDGCITVATATSGIAATMLPGGRTAHSRFKIPIHLDSSSMCLISKQSDLADLLRLATVLIWDEAAMTHRHAFEAFGLVSERYYWGRLTIWRENCDFRGRFPTSSSCCATRYKM